MNPLICEHLLHLHGDRLLLYARTWCSSTTDADDILQEACMKWLRASSGIKPPEIALLYACIRTSALDWMRSQQRRLVREFKTAMSPESAFLPDLHRDDLRLSVETALERLPLEQREVVVLKVWGGRTFDEISRIMGTSINTAMSRWRYACNALRGSLSQEFRS